MSFQDLFKYINGSFCTASTLSWSKDIPLHRAFEKQYYLVFKLIKHFEPGEYSSKRQFLYEFKLINKSDIGAFFNTLRSKFKKLINGENDISSLPEERLIWLYLLDDGVACILKKKSNDAFKQISQALIKGFVKFIQEAKYDRFETFRIAAHNITKFAAQILPYFSAANSISKNIDLSILDKQIELISDILSSEEDMFNIFASLMDVYNEYWENREIIGNFPSSNKNEIEIDHLNSLLCLFKDDVEAVMLKLLTIVENALSKKVEIQQVIQFFRLYNEFLKHYQGIDCSWLISKNCFINSLKNFPNVVVLLKKVEGEKNYSYHVAKPMEFNEILKNKKINVPKHYILKTIIDLLGIISQSLSNEKWSNEDRLKVAGDLFLAIGHSFIYFKEQINYIDFDHFLKDSTAPFKNVVSNSDSYRNFKTRLDNVEKFFVYSRKQNQLDIEETLNLFKKENRVNVNGFSSSINFDILRKCYKKYLEKLNSLKDFNIPDILINLRDECLKINMLPIEKWTPEFKQNTIPILLACSAAVWILQESKDVASIQKRIEPHCVQIVCILRLLGADSMSNGLNKHFAEVLTGQGKSLIFGLLSSVLALTGNEAFIVCYSKYLAVRDEEAFKKFFESFAEFDVKSKVSYHTFGSMAEEILTRKINGEKLSMRTVINDMLLGKLQTLTFEEFGVAPNKVLLIDEVDVLFSHYFGQTYNPCSTLPMSALLKIQPEIWKIVESGVYDEFTVLERITEFVCDLIKDETYIDFRNFLSTSNTLFKENLEKMVQTAIHVSKEKDNADCWFSKSYLIDYNGFISYRERIGSYCSFTYISYYNIFNYFRIKKENFDSKDYRNYGYFYIIWGSVSYANLPLEYKNILGVSGTLTTLNEYEKSAIKEYGIRTMSRMPSFFGDRNLYFDPSIHFTIQDSVDSWLEKISDRISDKIRDGRAVIVFFQTHFEIKMFEDKYRDRFDRLYRLIGNEDPSAMNWLINEAGVSRTITLATSAYGRGVDFKSNDQSVERKGGTHVIQTFLSQGEKEQTQFQGRTARMTNKGSYELIVCRSHLKDIECHETVDDSPVSNYQEVCAAREARTVVLGAEIEASIKKSEKMHELTLEFLKSFSKYTPETRQVFLSYLDNLTKLKNQSS